MTRSVHTPRVLVLYAPIFHPHLAVESSSGGQKGKLRASAPSSPQLRSRGSLPGDAAATAPSASYFAARADAYSAANSRGGSPNANAAQSPAQDASLQVQSLGSPALALPNLPSPGVTSHHSAPPLQAGALEDEKELLDTQRSRSVQALQEAGKHVLEHLEERFPSRAHGYGVTAADDAVHVDLFSILPASYIRSNHAAFGSNNASSFSTPHRTTSGSSADSAQHATEKSGPFAAISNFIHRHSPAGPLSRTNSRSASVAPSRRASLRSPRSRRGSNSPSTHGGSSHPVSAADAASALLALTDVLRDEDAAAEVAREQLLDRLTVLAGELEDGGVRRHVEMDVRQAADGESLLEALHSLLRERGEGGYDELIVLNDAEWEHEGEHHHAADLASPQSKTSCAYVHHSPSCPSAMKHSSSSHGVHKKKKKLTFDLSKLHFPHHRPHHAYTAEEQEHERVAIAPLDEIRRDLHHDRDMRGLAVVAL